LDEIAEMPLDTQSYLLRVLESGEFIRVGSSVVHKTDVRVIAATNVELLEKIKQGKFREDLYYRLNTVPIKVPSLKERQEDIYMLFRKFTLDIAEKYKMDPISVDADAKGLLLRYPWPGNIRELRNVAEQLSILSEDKMITPAHLHDVIPTIRDRHLPSIPKEDASGLHEREILYKVLFDMKNDLNDLKSLIVELIRNNDLEVSNTQSLRPLQLNGGSSRISPYFEDESPMTKVNEESGQLVHDGGGYDLSTGEVAPVIINKEDYSESEIVEDNLSLESMERSMISKALKKHGGRRKEAAAELGISERTLYRKIKNYDM